MNNTEKPQVKEIARVPGETYTNIEIPYGGIATKPEAQKAIDDGLRLTKQQRKGEYA